MVGHVHPKSLLQLDDGSDVVLEEGEQLQVRLPRTIHRPVMCCYQGRECCVVGEVVELWEALVLLGAAILSVGSVTKALYCSRLQRHTNVVPLMRNR